MPLTLKSLTEANLKRNFLWMPDGLGTWSSDDWIIAIAGEVGELAGEIKKINRTRAGIIGNKTEPDTQDIAYEMADVIIYLDLYASSEGLTLVNIVHNMTGIYYFGEWAFTNLCDETYSPHKRPLSALGVHLITTLGALSPQAPVTYLSSDYGLQNQIYQLLVGVATIAKALKIDLGKAIADKFNKVSAKFGFDIFLGAS